MAFGVIRQPSLPNGLEAHTRNPVPGRHSWALPARPTRDCAGGSGPPAAATAEPRQRRPGAPSAPPGPHLPQSVPCV